MSDGKIKFTGVFRNLDTSFCFEYWIWALDISKAREELETLYKGVELIEVYPTKERERQCQKQK